MPIVQGLNRFRIAVRAVHLMQDGQPVWFAWEQRDHFVYVSRLVGEFALEYVPLSIVYCPPGQDMTSALSATVTNRTQFTFTEIRGISEEYGTETRTQFGLKIAGFGLGGDLSEVNSQSTNSQATKAVSVGYDESWSTTIVADNRTTIGRKYWGLLGDIDVLMRNP